MHPFVTSTETVSRDVYIIREFLNACFDTIACFVLLERLGAVIFENKKSRLRVFVKILTGLFFSRARDSSTARDKDFKGSVHSLSRRCVRILALSARREALVFFC